VEALEKACAATKGWKLMSRGGSLNEPTVADSAQVRAVTLPRGVKPSRLGDTTVTSARPAGGKRGFLKFLIGALVAGAALALIALQAPPWLASLDRQTPTEEVKSAKVPEPPKAPPSEEPPATPTPTAEASPADAKPSALAAPPASETKRARAESTREAGSTAPTRSVQPIVIISSPGGAKAMLDNRADAVCTTPCSVDAAPGRHMIAVSLAGYQSERREVDVGTSPVELPAVILRAPGGTLMLTSVPSGAAVLVDGKPTGKTTPAQLTLAPGNYKITIEHEGRQVTQAVQLGSGLSYLKITM
jgi:serine/threonine-protein kinase